MRGLSTQSNAALPSEEASFYRTKVPAFLYANLKPGFGQRPYQQEAFGRFVHYLEDCPGKPVDQPIQLLFHMATGSGKTVIMAGLMIYLYSKGYRNFLFFVNSSNIIEKTKDNFTNPFSSKYLFAENIIINKKRVAIRVAENFEGSREDEITIVFTTIQGLHARLNTPRENAVTYEDFADKRIVLLSDEAHHINAETKKGPGLANNAKEALVSWEGTVNRIFNASKANLLLEFTATPDFTVPEIKKKYADRVLFDYPLKQFRKDGYSKEVRILQTDSDLFERVVQALLLSQYRQKVFEKNRLHIKPVILFKSKTIWESQAFYSAFLQKLKHLDGHQLQAVRDKSDGVLQKAFSFFAKNGLSLDNLALELKADFAEEKCIIVNSKEESEQKQIAINTLEEEGNKYRAVFAVDKLNEGWDVLNLFDIVRLYDTRDAKGGRPGKTTVSEAQLIGRGARYCPFQVKPHQPTDRRKYDDDLENELRVCEELFFHSAYNLRYIQELNTALVEIGIKPALTRECHLLLKDSFKGSSFYQKEYLFLNEREKAGEISNYNTGFPAVDQPYRVRLHTGATDASMAFADLASRNGSDYIGLERKVYLLSDFGHHVIRKAMSRLPFYQFFNLKKGLPHLRSLSQFITSDSYLNKVRVEVAGAKGQVENLSAEEKLRVVTEVLQQVVSAIATPQQYRGTRGFKPVLLKDILKDKTVSVAVEKGKDSERGKSMIDPLETDYYLDVKEKEWYVFEDCFGTSAEKKLILCFNKIYSVLKQSFDEIFLVRNDRFFRLFDFDSGRAFEPAFILFLKNNESFHSPYYQIFIQVEEAHSPGKTLWERNFLEQLQEENKLSQASPENRIFIRGLLFRKDQPAAFEEELRLLVDENEAVLKS